MRYIMTILMISLALTLPAQSFFDRVDAFFSENVVQGDVNYKAIKAKPEGLNELLDQIAQLDLSNKRVTPDYLKAFYINSYNILVIKQVVDLYPIKGPLSVEGFFNEIPHKVMGRMLTLDQLEKEVLYQQFPDPRLHFVLVCAAKGCPPLASQGYQPDQLEKQLNDRTSVVLNLDWFIRVNKGEVKISQIFDWYKGDFVKSEGSVKAFINKYRRGNIGANTMLKFYEYDWNLNEI